MELATNGKLSFLVVEIVKHMSRLETKVYIQSRQILDYYCIIIEINMGGTQVTYLLDSRSYESARANLTA